MPAMFDAAAQRQSEQERDRSVRRILWIVLILNLVVAVAKFVYGIITSSSSMQADGIHSSFDSINNIVCLVGLAIASRPADESHPYGHKKFETYASLVIGISLILAAGTVVSEAAGKFMGSSEATQVNVGSFVVMGLTLCMNIGVSTVERRKGKELRSDMLVADAEHTMSDVWVSLSVIAGLVLVKLGLDVADPIVSLLVAVFIARAAFEILRQVNASLADMARLPERAVRELVESVDGVRSAHNIRTRGTESAVYADLHVLVDPAMTVRDAHEVANTVERVIQGVYPQVVDVTVHVEPDDDHERREGALEDGLREENTSPRLRQRLERELAQEASRE